MCYQIKPLIIDSDDFGLTKSVSQGIITAMTEGVVTDTNAITTLPDVNESFALAKEHGIQAMGIHLNLEVGQSVYYCQSFDDFPFSMEEENDYQKIENEFFAQIEVLLNAGIQLTHITSHKALFVNPKMVKILEKLALFYKVPVRRLKNPSWNKELENRGIKMTDFSFINPKHTPYSLTLIENYFKQIRKTPGSVELICHVGLNSLELMNRSSLNKQREKELRLFTHPQIKDIIKSAGFELTNYQNLF